ncbi:unnamed protein product [Calypogeia fissa]
MAVVSGNWEIVNLLKKASLEMKLNPYNIGEIPPQEGLDAHHIESNKETALKTITKAVLIQDSRQDYDLAARELYDHDWDFNFLDISLYFLHFTFSTWYVKKNDKLKKVLENIQKKIFQRLGKNRIF